MVPHLICGHLGLSLNFLSASYHTLQKVLNRRSNFFRTYFQSNMMETRVYNELSVILSASALSRSSTVHEI